MSFDTHARVVIRSVVLLWVSAIHIACESSSEEMASADDRSQSDCLARPVGRILGPAESTPNPPSEHSLPTWRIEDIPLVLATGAAERGDSVFFNGVTAGSFMRDGGFVVGMGQVPSSLKLLLYFDSLGTTKTISGRTGDGPGEFRSIGAVFYNGDELVVMDRRLWRASWFSIQGDFIGTTSLQDDEFRGWVVGAFGDRTIVTTHQQNDAECGSRRYALWNSDGSFLGSLHGPSEPAIQSVLRIEGTGTTSSGSQTVFEQSEAWFCFPRTASVVVPNAVIVVEPDAGIVYSLERDGTLSIVYKSERRGTVTQEMIDGLHEQIRRVASQMGAPSMSGGRPKEVTGAFDRLGVPGSPMPSAWAGALRDSSGEQVWLRPANCYFRPVAERWEVISIDGRPIAEVIVPDYMSVLAVSADRVLARTRDELGVEQVGVYSVER